MKIKVYISIIRNSVVRQVMIVLIKLSQNKTSIQFHYLCKNTRGFFVSFVSFVSGQYDLTPGLLHTNDLLRLVTMATSTGIQFFCLKSGQEERVIQCKKISLSCIVSC